MLRRHEMQQDGVLSWALCACVKECVFEISAALADLLAAEWIGWVVQ